MRSPQGKTVRRLAIVGLAIAGALVAGDGRAISLATIDPLYFNGPSRFGFTATELASAGLSVAGVASPLDTWLSAGSQSLTPLPTVGVDQHLATVYSNPQAAGHTPSLTDPVIADSTWTVRNNGTTPLPASYLVFVQADPANQYPGMPIGLDGDLLSILDYSYGGTDYLFGAIPLPALGVGQSFDVTVRYVVAGRLDYDAGQGAYLLPRFGLSDLVLPVPEPGTATALALGLVAIGGCRRALAGGDCGRSS